MGVNNSRNVRKPPVVKALTEADIAAEKKKANHREIITVLLQGSGESGKSTILRQMQLIYGKGFDNDSRNNLKKNLLATLLETASWISEKLEETKEDYPKAAGALVVETNQKRIENDGYELNADIAAALVSLANNNAFISYVNSGASTAIQDNYLVLMNKLSNFPAWGGPGWIPGDEDILQTRWRTTGTIDNYFQVDKMMYNIIDVGGQKNERSRHQRLFEQVRAIMFVASISDYNLNLFEDASENRLVDSLEFFRRLCHTKSLSRAGMLLFLNKFDILQEKYYREHIPLPVLEGYPTPPTYDQEEDEGCALAIEWFKAIYAQQAPANRVTKDTIHVTNAIAKDLMEQVIKNVSESLLRMILRDMAM